MRVEGMMWLQKNKKKLEHNLQTWRGLIKESNDFIHAALVRPHLENPGLFW
jgi:hypothetical protein